MKRKGRKEKLGIRDDEGEEILVKVKTRGDEKKVKLRIR